jgi:outer membrane lipoprotein-sorting protein
MKTLRFLLAPVALATVAFAAPVMAAEIPMAELSRYLNALTTAQAGFTQINADGTIATGQLYIQRPGRVRFEYAPPDDNLVMAGGGQVAVFDAKSNQPPEQYPLSRTPLSLILDQTVDLARDRMVVGHREDGPSTRVTARDPDYPETGTIELVFTAEPTQLRQWIITDETGGQTTVILGDMTVGGALPPSLFDITFETEKRMR